MRSRGLGALSALPRLGDVRPAQASVALRAGLAIAQRALKLHGHVAHVIAVGAILVERLAGRPAGRADAGAGGGIAIEVRRTAVLPCDVSPGFALVMKRIGLLRVVGTVIAGVGGDQCAVAQVRRLAEQRCDLIAQGADEICKGSKVRHAVAGQGDAENVLTTGASDAATADNALRVGQQHDLEHHGRRVGAGAGHVVPVAGIETRQIDLAIDPVVQRMLEGAGKQLPLKIAGEETRAGVYVFVADHKCVSERSTSMTLDIPDGSPQNA